jgi:hypothetical protein
MSTIIKTKWGQLIIDAEQIYEVNIRINPWDNVYTIEFILEGSYQRLYAEFNTSNELMNHLRFIISDIAMVKQYKYKDSTGQLQIDEKRRMSIMNSKKNTDQSYD